VKREDPESTISYAHQRRKIRPVKSTRKNQLNERKDQCGLKTKKYRKIEAKMCKGRLIKCKHIAADWFN